MTVQKVVKLNDGVQAPVYAFGTASKLSSKECKSEVVMAISEAGVRHIDTAAMYRNEASVGRAIGLGRHHVFLTSKCDENVPPTRSLTESLKVLGFDHVDLFLIHSPMWVQGSGLGEAWRQMEMLQANGKTKSIGVSNYRIMDLEETLKGAEVVPAVNQIEIHPYVYDRARPLIDYCHRKGGPVDPIVDRIALELGITNDQVLLKWAHQVSHEGIVVTSSLKKDRILGQMRTLNEVQVLSESQVQEIAQAGLLKHQRVWEHHMDDE